MSWSDPLPDFEREWDDDHPVTPDSLIERIGDPRAEAELYAGLAYAATIWQQSYDPAAAFARYGAYLDSYSEVLGSSPGGSAQWASIVDGFVRGLEQPVLGARLLVRGWELEDGPRHRQARVELVNRITAHLRSEGLSEALAVLQEAGLPD